MKLEEAYLIVENYDKVKDQHGMCLQELMKPLML